MDITRRFANVGLAGLLLLVSTTVQADFFEQTNLVSSISGLATFTDPNLKNPWGISHSGGSPNWVSNQVTGTATLYNGAGQPFPVATPLVVTIPGAGLEKGPTGQVFNSTAADFMLTTGGKATFLFANLDGSISGWNNAQGTLAQVVATTPGAVFTGLALGNNGSANFLYAANENNGINVFNGAFGATSLAGSFTDPNLPAGFTPYNIQNINNTLYVTYENETSGGGVINRFDFNGNLLGRLTSNADGGPLDSPWGLALAPAGFGPFGGALLVGNEDDGHINAFNPITGAFLGTLLDATNNPIANTGLWGLTFGNGGTGGDPNTLFFAAGIEDETEGLLGAIRAVPEPASSLLFLLGALALVATRRRGHKTT